MRPCTFIPNRNRAAVTSTAWLGLASWMLPPSDRSLDSLRCGCMLSPPCCFPPRLPSVPAAPRSLSPPCALPLRQPGTCAVAFQPSPPSRVPFLRDPAACRSALCGLTGCRRSARWSGALVVRAASARTDSTPEPEACSVGVLSCTVTVTYDNHHCSSMLSLIQQD